MNLINVSLCLMITLLSHFSSLADAQYCDFDNDCPAHLKCTTGICKDPCIGKCAADERCSINIWHEATCTYVPAACRTNNNCEAHLKCNRRARKCVDPCINYCNYGENCIVLNHLPNCYRN